MATQNYSLVALLRSGLAVGDMIYRTAAASGWSRLAVGTAAQVLRGGTTPGWAAQNRFEMAIGTVANASFAPFDGTHGTSAGLPFTPRAFLCFAWNLTNTMGSIGWMTTNATVMVQLLSAAMGAASGGGIMGNPGQAKSAWTPSGLTTNPTWTISGATVDTYAYAIFAFE